MQFVGNASLPNDGNAGYYNNTIYNIFLLPPNKAESLAFLDAEGPAPARYAQAIVIRGAMSPPDTMVYKVRMSSTDLVLIQAAVVTDDQE